MGMIKRTGSADFPDKLKALVSGPPKSGKTSLIGTIPNIIVADTEPHANNLASLAHLDVPYVTINKLADLRELQMVLASDGLRQEAAKAAGMDRIDAVAIDTLDTLQKIMKRERLAEQRQTKFLRDDWGWLKEEMTKIIEGFTALPLHVVFTVHLKTKEIGTEDAPQTKVLPGLEGAIADEVAGMVGYSFLSFRKEEVSPTGQRYTKYWLRAEGDETYDFVGNRTAGRLPDVIEPDFAKVYAAATAGRPTQAAPAPAQIPQIQQSSQQAAPTQQPTQQQAPAQGTQAPVQQAGPESGPPSEPAPAPQQAAPQQAQQAPAATSGPPSGPAGGPAPDPARAPDTDPVNEAALQHVKKVFDAVSAPFDEKLLRTKTLGDARGAVKMWQAIQRDALEGKLPEGSTQEGEMASYLEACGLVGSASSDEQSKTVEPKLGGTIEQVKAWVGDDSDLGRVQEAYRHEQGQSKPRASLISWLESKGAGAPEQNQTGAQTPTPGDDAPASDAQQPAQQPSEQQQPEQQQSEQAIPAAQGADESPTEDQAIQAVQEGLGAAVVGNEVNADALCEACGKPIDDADIAKLSVTRFKKVLCVGDYIEATRSPA